MLRTLTTEDINQLDEIHRSLRRGKTLSEWRKWLYKHAGSKLVWVVTNNEGLLVGFNMYYFRENEWFLDIVHEAFIGVLPEYRGLGLASSMRMLAAEYLAKAGIKGISTQISINNIPSLRSARTQGFKTTGGNPDGKLVLLKLLQSSR